MATNATVTAMLRELITLTTLEEESPQSFKVRAYENARLGIEAHGADITDLTAAELTKIKGVGKSTAAKIREFLDTGTVDKLEKLRAAYPPAFVELSKIPGLGPKTLKLVRSELGVEDLEGLKAAIDAERLRELPRMGATSEAKIKKAIERLGLTGKDRRTPIAEALPLAERLIADLRAIPEVAMAEFCGSLRRMSETIGDIDITVASTEPATVMAAVVAHPEVAEIV
ncbi:MAG: helix-hairpin-helix domain-containing protein, partial [Actinomycetota bacterium]